MSDATVEEIAEEAKKPGKFSIINVLKDRGYPEDTVTVRLDEQSAYKASILKAKINDLEIIGAKSGIEDGAKDNPDIEKLVADMQILIDEIESHKYIFHITGISEGKREKLLAEASEKFPAEFYEEKNPYSGEIKHVEKENKDRDRLFTNLLWENHIVKIIAPDGSEQTDITTEDVAELRESLPLVAIGAITEGIEKIRISTAMFLYSADEDFLAKS